MFYNLKGFLTALVLPGDCNIFNELIKKVQMYGDVDIRVIAAIECMVVHICIKSDYKTII